jgi:manganese/zinc/iron transport system permease protein
MEFIQDLLSFQNPNLFYVVVGSILLTGSSAIIGSFTFLHKKALLGDAISHAILPGICLAFILSGTRNPIILIIGATITGWLSVMVVDFIVNKTRIKEDSAIGIVLSVFFGVGIVLMTIIQKTGNASQAGLDHFLFGKAAAMVGQDLMVFSVVAIAMLVCVILFFKEFTILAFDRAYATTIGLPVKTIQFILTTLIVLAVVIGIQAVGVVLMAAILITPAAAARFWTNQIHTLIIVACLLGAISGLCGAYISYVAPAMPTGPWIVMVMSTLALLSFFLAPKRGVLSRYWRQRAIFRTINDENLLKVLYQLGEEGKNFFQVRTLTNIQQRRQFPNTVLPQILHRLRKEGYIEEQPNGIVLTQEGMLRGQRIVKIHRLWELYLTTHVNIAPDHVHEDADTIEHLLTPELEAELEHILNYPTEDPHQAEIPYRKQ